MNETTKAIIDNIIEELFALQESINGGDVSVPTKAVKAKRLRLKRWRCSQSRRAPS